MLVSVLPAKKGEKFRIPATRVETALSALQKESDAASKLFVSEMRIERDDAGDAIGVTYLSDKLPADLIVRDLGYPLGRIAPFVEAGSRLRISEDDVVFTFTFDGKGVDVRHRVVRPRARNPLERAAKLAAKSPEKALALVAEVLARGASEKEQLQAARIRAEVFVGLGRLADAEPEYATMARLQPGYFTEYQWAALLAELGRGDESDRVYERFDNRTLSLRHRGYTRLHIRHEYELALADFEEAAAIEEVVCDRPKLLFLPRCCHHRLGRYEDMLASPWPWSRLGARSYEQNGGAEIDLFDATALVQAARYEEGAVALEGYLARYGGWTTNVVPIARISLGDALDALGKSHAAKGKRAFNGYRARKTAPVEPSLRRTRAPCSDAGITD